MDPLILILLIVVGGTLGLALLASMGDRRPGTRMIRQRERRDPIAAGVIRSEDVTTTLERENARRERHGLGRLRRGEFEARVVGDARTRRKVWLWKGRR